MSIITGGTTKPGSSGGLGAQNANNKTPLKASTKAPGYAGIDIHEQFAGRGTDQ